MYALTCDLFQSTLPRGERRLVPSHSSWYLYFNPHSREGSDKSIAHIPKVYQNFNPHSRVGSDKPCFAYSDTRTISIHTPAWGATPGCALVFNLSFYFNPHSRVGSDRCSWQNSGTIYKFQSTLPRGERPHASYYDAWDYEFQSTLPRGERLILPEKQQLHC